MTPPRHRQSGIALLEGLISILIFSMGILAVMGLQAVSVKNTALGKYRGDASFLANSIVGQMWADAANLASYSGSSYAPKKNWEKQVEDDLPGGKGTIELAGSQATVTVSWTIPGVAGTIGTQKHVVFTTITP